MSKHSSTKACEIPPEVKAKVWERDGECSVLSGKWVPVECACCHYIARKPDLGLGIEQNIVTLTPEEHDAYDKTVKRKDIREKLRLYLQSKYPDWDESKLVYRKYERRTV